MDPLPEPERTLFERLKADSTALPVRTLARHALGFHRGQVLKDGGTYLAVPAQLRPHAGVPASVFMGDDSILRNPYDARLDALPKSFHAHDGGPTTLTFWLDEEALGSHAGAPMDRALCEKLEARTHDMKLALEARHQLPDRGFDWRLCIPTRAFREATGHRACGAIVVAAAPPLAGTLAHIRETLLEEQQQARKSIGNRQKRLGDLLPPKPTSLVTGVNVAPAPKPVQDTLLPARPTVHMAQLSRQLGKSFGEIAVHELGPDGSFTLRPLDPDHTHAPESVRIHAHDSLFTGRHKPTHLMTLWLHDPRLVPLYDLATSDSPDADEAAERLHTLLRPTMDWMLREYGGEPVQYYPMPLEDPTAPLMLVISVDAADQRDILRDAQAKLHALRQQAHHGKGRGA